VRKKVDLAAEPRLSRSPARAAALGASERTASRRWTAAGAWLKREVERGAG
jgi:hypothetical protein